ncbi:hypothetical protein D9M68_369540 [compost metagenome]
MLAVSLDHLFAEAEELARTDLEAAFLFGLAPRCGFRAFHMIDLAADDVPVLGFRRVNALVEQDLAVAHDCKSAAETRKIDARQAHRFNQALPAISMKAGISSPKPTGVGPSS